MKKIVSIFLLAALLSLFLVGCRYNPPEGAKEAFHTYEEVLAYAQGLDPEATVSETAHDGENEYGYRYREWDAVILGVSCHVGSVERLVSNEGLFAGELMKPFCFLDTDYDYCLLKEILSETQPAWRMDKADSARYAAHGVITVETHCDPATQLEFDALLEIWLLAKEVNTAYESRTIGDTAKFAFGIPTVVYGQGMEPEIKDGFLYAEDFTAYGQNVFLDTYNQKWTEANNYLMQE